MSSLTFTGNGKEIAAALGHISASINKASTMPILSCYAISLDGGKLMARATDLDAMHCIELPVVIERGEKGAGACAAASLLSGLLSRCNGDEARVSIDGGTLVVASAGRKATMNVLPLAEFPEPHEPMAEWHEIDGGPLGSAIRGVAFATSYEETRYVLNGVYLAPDSQVVATDGRRLALMQLPTALPGCLAGVIVPNKAIGPIADLLDRHGKVSVAADDSGICLRASGEIFYTKRIEGNYPNFQQVIPRFHEPVKATVDREPMQKALSWAKLMRKAKDSAVKLIAKDEQLTISIASPEIGEAEEVLPLRRGEGVTFKVALNLTYLEQMVARDEGDYFTLECEPEKSDHSKGAVMGPLLVREENEAFLGVLMPMRLQ